MRVPLRPRARWLIVAMCLGVASIVALLVLQSRRRARDDQPTHPLYARGADYVGASTCQPCHVDRFASWRRTYHSTMTQIPSAKTVLGHFDGAAVAAFGAEATPFTRDGRFYFRLPAMKTHEPREAEVALCVGSHRYQQYFERVDGPSGVTYERLPLLWSVVEARWLHLNGVFLEPDNDDWSAHQAIWNMNCVFCHNTGVVPGLKAVLGENQTGDTKSERKTFNTHVADIGIGCESCHGPARAHVEAQRNEPHADRDIVSPKHLGQAESAALCGQCHSQRLPDPPEKIWAFLDTGPTFRPGGKLAGHVAPLTRDTAVPDPRQPADVFRQRFWNDGTPRLTAYEYLGTTQSPCFKGGTYSCGSCHAMHEGDVAGQMRPSHTGDHACTTCHEAIAKDITAHTHHAPNSSGSRCLDCHMPPIVYGVLGVRRSHRVESPDVRRDVEAGRPNACTLCHLDRDALWAADRMRDFWGARYQRPQTRPDQAPLDIPEALASMHAGDPVQRAVYYARIGRTDNAVDPATRAGLLANTLVGLGDGYGAIRLLARQSALSLDRALQLAITPALQAYDVQSERAQRDPQLAALLHAFESAATARLSPGPAALMVGPDYRLDLGRIRGLLEHQAGQAISIGE